MQAPVIISAAVEGIVDEAVVRRIVVLAGAKPGPVYGKDGKNLLKQRINGYNHAARRSPWLVLVDLDHDAACAPPLREAWLPEAARYLCFRIAVREVEAWLMADAETLAEFLRVARKRIPTVPEQLQNPKEVMVTLARGSRRRDICTDMVPRQGSGRAVGPAYTSRLVEYVERHWRPEVAAQHAPSLRAALACLRGLIESTATSSEARGDPSGSSAHRR